MSTQQPPNSSQPCVLFDLDGTLVDSAPDLHRAAARMNQKLGLATRSIDEVRAWIGDGMKMLVERVLAGSASPEIEAACSAQGLVLFQEAYAEAPCCESQLYPGVRQTLDDLVRMGTTLGVVTNKAHAFAVPILRQLEIEEHFSVVVGGDTLPTRKPEAEPLLYAISQLNTCGRGVLVGDSEVDIRAAHAAKIPVVAVSYGYNRGRDLSKLRPYRIIDSMNQLPEVLATLT